MVNVFNVKVKFVSEFSQAHKFISFNYIQNGTPGHQRVPYHIVRFPGLYGETLKLKYPANPEQEKRPNVIVTLKFLQRIFCFLLTGTSSPDDHYSTPYCYRGRICLHICWSLVWGNNNYLLYGSVTQGLGTTEFTDLIGWNQYWGSLDFPI